MKSHYVCVMIFRSCDTKRDVEFLVMDSVSTDPRSGKKTNKQVKFPGGMNRIPDESIQLTLQREALEETHLALLPEAGKEVWKKEVNAEHVKYGFLVNFQHCRGELRTEVLHDSGDEMSPPYWATVSDLRFVLYDTHQPPFVAACRELGLL